MPYNNQNNVNIFFTIILGLFVLLISFIKIPLVVYQYFNGLNFKEIQCTKNRLYYDLPKI